MSYELSTTGITGQAWTYHRVWAWNSARCRLRGVPWCQNEHTTVITWHNPEAAWFHGMVHGTRSMGPTVAIAIALSVERAMGDPRLYHEGT